MTAPSIVHLKMAAPMEILLTSDASGMLWNLCVWDFQTGTAIKSFKGGSSAPRSVCLLDGYFLISAAVGKPIIHVWAAQKKVVALVAHVCYFVMHAVHVMFFMHV